MKADRPVAGVRPNSMGNPAGETSGTRVRFKERMRREGRIKEFAELQRKLRDEEHLQSTPAQWRAMRMMGYESADKERELEQDFIDNCHKTAKQREVEKLSAERAALYKTMDFEGAVATLPDTASSQVEIDWIRAHPAMSRLARQKDKTKDVVLDIDDVVKVSHGVAPSKSAVHALQHWANHPTEFYKSLMSEQKKATEGVSGGSSSAGSDDFSEVERLLMEVRGGTSKGSEGLGRVQPGGDSCEALPDSEADGERTCDYHGADS